MDPHDVQFGVLDYEASGGMEYFLSFEDFHKEVLIGYARLRLCSDAAYLRELKVFGHMVPFHGIPGERWQHRGYGAALMSEAESIALDSGYEKLHVTSGVGARGYYRKLGYGMQGPYMVKQLT